MDKLLDLFVECNKKYKELFSLLYTVLGGVAGIILYRERKKYKEGTAAAKIDEHEKRLKEIGGKVEDLEDKVSSITANISGCQRSRAQILVPVQTKIDEMEKRLLYMLESNRREAKTEKEHEIEMLMARIDKKIEGIK